MTSPLNYILAVVVVLVFSCQPKHNPDILISDINIIDIEKGKVIEQQDVFIEGNKIYKIDDHQQPKIEAYETVDGKGKYLIPGLWDMHAHIRSYSHEDILPLFILYGVVGIRDLGLTNFELIKSWKSQIEKREIIGPRIRSSGCIIEGSFPRFKNSITITEIEKVKPVVDSLIAEGVDLIKLYDTLEKEIYEAISSYCQQNGILTAGHIPPSINQINASEIGLKSIEHLSGLDNTLHKYYSQEDFDKFIESLQANRTYQCPTLVNFTFLASLDGSKNERKSILNQIDNEPRFDLATKYHKAWWSQIKANYSKSKKYKGKAEKLLFYKKIVKHLNDNGVKILAGTDTPNPYILPGLSLHEELILLVESGLSTSDVLKTATLYPAQYFDYADYTGTIREKSIADLVILDANPLEDISNTQRINAVILNGKLLTKDSLSAIRTSQLERMNGYNIKDFDQYIYMKLQKEGINTIINNYKLPKNNSTYTVKEEYLLRLSSVLKSSNLIDDAIKLLEWNIEIFPDYPASYHSLGHLYLEQGDTLNAIENFEIIKDMTPSDTVNLAMLKLLVTAPN